MKRSEMVKVILDKTLEVYGIFDPEIVKLMLKTAEDHGMLPPPTGIEYGITRTLCYVGYDYLEMEDDVKQSLWEPEDEEE